jgi:Kef-type K+ transport system membrane component KefB
MRYAVLGLIAGGLWLWGSGDPLWLHALRMLAIVLIIPALASRLNAAVARRHGKQRTETISVGRLVAIKAGLVIVALAVTALLGSRLAHLDLYVAAWLALTLALGGPAIHHRLLIEVTDGQHPHRRRLRSRRTRPA